MKRLISFFVLLIGLCASSSAQDVIVKRNGDEIQARVTEVGTSEIKYRRFDSPDGPLYVVLKSDVFMIRYANGVKEVMPAEHERKASAQPAREHDPRIEQRGSWYYQDSRRLSERALQDIFIDAKDDQALAELKLARGSDRGGRALMVASIPLLAAGTVALVWGTLFRSIAYQSYNDTYRTGQEMQIGGGIGMALGFVLLGTGIGVSSGAKAHMERAVQIYNTGIMKKEAH